MNLAIQSTVIKAEVERLLMAFPELADDPILMMDAIEGETDMFAFIEILLSNAREAGMMAEAIKGRVGELNERKARFERRAEASLALIRSLMMQTGIKKIPLPEATISLSKGRAYVDVLNVDDLPQGLFHIERKADKKAIQSALEAGETVPGAVMATGKTSLMITTK